MEFETTIMRGLPVTVKADRERGDDSLYPSISVSAIYLRRVRKRDRRVDYRPIPDSWWSRIEQNGDLDRLISEAQER